MAAENLLLSYARDKGLPAVATVHIHHLWPRRLGADPARLLDLALVATGRFPFYFGYSTEVVGIEDAARAMLLAAEHGRNGERYIISDRYMSIRELHEIAATAVGRRPPRIGIPMSVLRAGARVNDLLARLLRRDLPFAYAGMRMAELMSPLDHSKAERELGWTPEPVEDSIRKAAVFFASPERWSGMRRAPPGRISSRSASTGRRRGLVPRLGAAASGRCASSAAISGQARASTVRRWPWDSAIQATVSRQSCS